MAWSISGGCCRIEKYHIANAECDEEKFYPLTLSHTSYPSTDGYYMLLLNTQRQHQPLKNPQPTHE